MLRIKNFEIVCCLSSLGAAVFAAGWWGISRYAAGCEIQPNAARLIWAVAFTGAYRRICKTQLKARVSPPNASPARQSICAEMLANAGAVSVLPSICGNTGTCHDLSRVLAEIRVPDGLASRWGVQRQPRCGLPCRSWQLMSQNFVSD